MQSRLEEVHRENHEMESVTCELARVKMEVNACSIELRNKDAEIEKKNAELTAALEQMSTLRTATDSNSAKALAHDSVVAENKAIMAHAMTLDGRIRELEKRGSADSVDKEASKRRRLQVELNSERARNAALAETMPLDKQQLAAEVARLRVQISELS